MKFHIGATFKMCEPYEKFDDNHTLVKVEIDSTYLIKWE